MDKLMSQMHVVVSKYNYIVYVVNLADLCYVVMCMDSEHILYLHMSG